MKRTYRTYPSKVYSAKHIKYNDMTYAGETPQELVDTLKSVINDNNLYWFYAIKEIKVRWGTPYPKVICILDAAGNYRLISDTVNSKIDWSFIAERQFNATQMREIADMLDVLNNSPELNDLITNFEEYYGEES